MSRAQDKDQDSIQHFHYYMSTPISAAYRTKRVKDARAEAQKEIEEYRQKKEEEFKKFEAEHSSGNKVAEDEANKEAEVKVQEIKDIGKKKGGQVVENLIHAVTDVQPQIPKKLARNA
ncbi:V-type ATPase, G subunit [[Emmonsia] crescens]|uniref:V-type proton ATPase subunit G n=1 Tax=[Emmonsia] crescens TaxID=73230 RepID=A0A2B7ZLE6_9EURO|nr:V-type ATPase, G subunit [Emmonsia crescens]